MTLRPAIQQQLGTRKKLYIHTMFQFKLQYLTESNGVM